MEGWTGPAAVSKMITYIKYRSTAGPNVAGTVKKLCWGCLRQRRLQDVCVFALCISCFTSSGWTCAISQLVLKTLFPPLLHPKAGICVGAPGLC